MFLEDRPQPASELAAPSHGLECHVDARAFDRDVIYKACYALTGRAWLWIEPQQDGLTVRISAKDGQEEQALARELGNLLIDFALRKAVAQETQEIRELLLRRALAGAGR